jgi:hypothetical protein
MDLSKVKITDLLLSLIAFAVYWIMNPIIGFVGGPEYLFSSVWWIICQIIFMPMTLWYLFNVIRQIAEPGEVRWFRDEDLLKIPPKEEKS